MWTAIAAGSQSAAAYPLPEQLLAAVIFLEMGSEYPFQAPQVSLGVLHPAGTATAGTTAGMSAATSMGTRGMANAEAIREAVPAADRLRLTDVAAVYNWSPPMTVRTLLAAMAPTLADGIGARLPAQQRVALLSCGRACAELWRRAASASVDVLWFQALGSQIRGQKNGSQRYGTELAESERGVWVFVEKVRYLHTPFQYR